jgi:hypothetical protein
LLKPTAAAAEDCLGLGGGWIFFERISGGGGGGGGSAARLTPLIMAFLCWHLVSYHDNSWRFFKYN